MNYFSGQLNLLGPSYLQGNLDLQFKRSRGNPNFRSIYGCSNKTKAVRIPINLVDQVKKFCLDLIGIGSTAIDDQPILQSIAIDDQPIKQPITIDCYDSKLSKDTNGFNVVDIKPGLVCQYAVKDIYLDPKRFQYKLIYNSDSGSTGSLTGVKSWNADLAGLILVWLDPVDNNVYCINGHNRLALAKKLNVDVVSVRFITAINATIARSIGAMANIADNRGNEFDAAKLFRDTDFTKKDLEKFGISLKAKLASDAIALANLKQHIFDKALQGNIALNIAVYAGKLDQDLQDDFIKLCSKRSNLTNEILNELLELIKNSDQQQTSEMTLFGLETITNSYAIERSDLTAYIVSRLKEDKNLFKTVSKKASKLERGNNQIDIATSQVISDTANTAITLFNQFKNLSGILSSQLNQYAKDISNNGNVTTIKQEAYQWVIDNLDRLSA